MKEETEIEIDTRRAQTVKYAKLNCTISCIVLVLNIIFVVGSILYIIDVRRNSVTELLFLHQELSQMKGQVDSTSRFVFNTIAPKQELIRRQLDTKFDENDDE